MHSGKEVKHPLCFLLLSWHRRKSSEKLCQATKQDINPKQLLFSATQRREITHLKHFHLSVTFKHSGDASGRISRWIDIVNNPLANVSIQPLPRLITHRVFHFKVMMNVSKMCVDIFNECLLY